MHRIHKSKWKVNLVKPFVGFSEFGRASQRSMLFLFQNCTIEHRFFKIGIWKLIKPNKYRLSVKCMKQLHLTYIKRQERKNLTWRMNLNWFYLKKIFQANNLIFCYFWVLLQLDGIIVLSVSVFVSLLFYCTIVEEWK